MAMVAKEVLLKFLQGKSENIHSFSSGKK